MSSFFSLGSTFSPEFPAPAGSGPGGRPGGGLLTQCSDTSESWHCASLGRTGLRPKKRLWLSSISTAQQLEMVGWSRLGWISVVGISLVLAILCVVLPDDFHVSDAMFGNSGAWTDLLQRPELSANPRTSTEFQDHALPSNPIVRQSQQYMEHLMFKQSAKSGETRKSKTLL